MKQLLGPQNDMATIRLGLTANEMAAYLAEDLDCEYAILLDGGGSTALTVDGETINVPSEERPVGNVMMLVHTPGEGAAKGGFALSVNTILWIVCGCVVAAAVVVIAATAVSTRRKPREDDGENN